MNLKINDNLNKYAFPNLLIYKVFGILEREDGTYWQIRCNSCQHGEKCEVLIKKDDNNQLVYVSILNEDEDDKQYYWHTTGENNYYQLSKKSALESVIKRNIKSCKNEIKELQERIESVEKRKNQQEEYLKGLDV